MEKVCSYLCFQLRITDVRKKIYFYKLAFTLIRSPAKLKVKIKVKSLFRKNVYLYTVIPLKLNNMRKPSTHTKNNISFSTKFEG